MPEKYSGETSFGRRNPGFLTTRRQNNSEKQRAITVEKQRKTAKNSERTTIASIVKQIPQPVAIKARQYNKSVAVFRALALIYIAFDGSRFLRQSELEIIQAQLAKLVTRWELVCCLANDVTKEQS
jgi:hypothetical protein